MKLIIVKIILLFSIAGSANNNFSIEQKESIFDQISYDEVVNVKLEFDFEPILNDRRNDEKHRSLLTFKDKHGNTQIWDTKIKIRGKFRRMKCNGIPPLKIYFDKEDLEAAGLAKFNDYKIVNYCSEDEFVAKEMILKEYLAYKMYNEITEESFRVQLVKITFKDSGSRAKMKQWAIIIEDTAEARDRMFAEKPDKDFNFNQVNFDIQQVQTMALFQFMIGNTDFSLEFEKNCKAMLKSGKLVLIPYDFDFSGLVNAPYAVPNSNFGLTSLQERLFLGIPEELYTIKPILKLYDQKKDNLFELINSNRQISRDSKNEMINYLTSFYENLSLKTLIRSTPEARARMITVPVKAEAAVGD